MELTRSEEQQELASTLRALLARRGGSAAVRAAADVVDTDLWQTLVEQVGVAALAVPEEHEGFGATFEETGVALEETGYALSPVPLLASGIATAALLLHGTDEQRAELLPRIATGAVATVALQPPLVLEPAAEIVLVPHADGLHLADDAPEPVGALDQTIRLGRLDVGSVSSRPLRDVAAALTTPLLTGVARRGLDMTVAHTKERVQFGRPIGSFQALKHRMADLLVLVEMSRSASWAACAAVAAYVADPTEARARTLRRRAAAAKAYCSEAAFQVAAETVQLHGGIGITWEHDAHLVLKRAHTLGRLFGPAHAHRATLLD